MKLKKYVAFAVSAMMALSSVASAAITQDEDGWYLQDTKPTKAAVEVRAVSVTPAVEKIDLTEAKTYGITAGKGSSAKTDENTDFYKVTLTVNNIGELYSAYDINSDYATMWSVKMFNIAISIPGVGTNKQAVTSSTFEGKSWSIGGDGLQLTYGANSNEAYPASTAEEGVYVNNPAVSVVAVYAVAKGTTLDVQPTVKVTYAINGTEDAADADGVGTANVVFGAAPATVDVESVTISGATAATVGDDVQLSATVLPDNATDKTVTWTKVSGNGAVSDSGVVTATAAGDVVVKATAGGVDSANYTVSFAAPAPTPVYTDSSIDVKKPVSGTTGLTDLQGQDVTLTANYGIAKFSKAIDIVANKYFVVATDSNDVEKEFEVDFAAKGVEISNVSTTFFAIVKSADHIIKSIRLKEIAR